MFKVAACRDAAGFLEAREIINKIYQEKPQYWPYGIDPNGFDGGLYLIREKQAGTAVGFCGWQERNELDGDVPVKVGYYSIGILPEHRSNGFAKQALQQLITAKSARVDRVKAMIVESNLTSRHLAEKLGVPAVLKAASFKFLS